MHWRKGIEAIKIAVIYNSQTGFTEQYARWISEAVGADCIGLAAAKKRDLAPYDTIVFGGWACAGKIQGISWLRSRMARWPGKTWIAFCTGGTPAESPEIEGFLRGNFSEDERKRVSVFYCPGGFCYEKMPARFKLLMKMFQKMAGAKKEKTEAEKQMLEMISRSYDISDRKYIAPIVELLQQAQKMRG